MQRNSAATELSPQTLSQPANQDQPLGLPPGSVRAILAILTSLIVGSLIVLNYWRTGEVDENLLALLLSTGGAYLGVRAVSVATGSSQKNAVRAAEIAQQMVGPQVDAITARIQDEGARLISELQSENRELVRRLAISERLISQYQEERIETQLAAERQAEAERRTAEQDAAERAVVAEVTGELHGLALH